MNSIPNNPLFFKVVDTFEDSDDVTYTQDMVGARYRVNLAAKGNKDFPGRFIIFQKMSTASTPVGAEREVFILEFETFLV